MPSSEFQKIADLRDIGLALYRYVMIPRSSRRVCNVGATTTGSISQTVDSNDTFILHNTKNNEITRADYILALDRKPISSCLRCQEAVQRAQRLLRYGGTIGKRSVKCICENCLVHQDQTTLHESSCITCQDVIKRFAACIALNSALRSAYDSALVRKRLLKTKHPSPSLQRDIDIKPMFEPQEMKYHESDHRWSEIKRYGIQRSERRQSGDSMKTYDEMNVKFEVTPEIIQDKKVTLLKTVANMDDQDIAALVNNIKNALKEREDEAGTQLPYAKLMIGKTDEELEKIVLQTILTAEEDSDVERNIFELIDAQENAKKNLTEMKQRLQGQDIELEDTGISNVGQEFEKPTKITRKKEIASLVHERIESDRVIEPWQKKTVSKIIQSVDAEQEIDKVIAKFVELKIINPEEKTKFRDVAKLEYHKRNQDKNLIPLPEKYIDTKEKYYSEKPETIPSPMELKPKTDTTENLRPHGSLEKLVHQKVMQEKAQVKVESRNVASLIRKRLDTLRKISLYAVDPKEYFKPPQQRPKVAKPEDETIRLADLIIKKLQRAKQVAFESKENLPTTPYKLFRQKPVVDKIVREAGSYDKLLDTKPTIALTPIRKGAKMSLSEADKEQYQKISPHSTDSQLDNRKETLTPLVTDIKYKQFNKEKRYTTRITKTVEPKEELKVTKKKGKTDQLTKIREPLKEMKTAKQSPQRPVKKEKAAQMTKAIRSKEEKEVPKSTKLSVKELKAKQSVRSQKSDEAQSNKSSPKIIKKIEEDETAEMKAERLQREEENDRKSKMDEITKISEKLKKELERKMRAKRLEKEAKADVTSLDDSDKKHIPLDTLVKNLNKVLQKQDKAKKRALKMKEALEKKEIKYKARAHKRHAQTLGAHKPYVEFPKIPILPKTILPERSIIKERTGEEYLQLPFKTIRVRTPSIDDIILRLVKIRMSKFYKKKKEANVRHQIEAIIAEAQRKRKLKETEGDSDLDSDYLLDLESLLAGEVKEISDIIVGNEILSPKEAANKLTLKEIGSVPLPSVFKSKFEVPVLDELAEDMLKASQDTHSIKDEYIITSKTEPSKITESAVGVLRYKLSDKTFIDKGWTHLPTRKTFRRMNLYRMHPGNPEFDWFEQNKGKGYLLYDTGELLAIFDDSGHGRWYYRNGKIALDYYKTENLNAKKRAVVYSTCEPDKEQSRPVTVLGSFDFCGNGVVLDHSGNIRLKYNQAEGLILDNTIGPVSHWKWHDLNEPPFFQQVWTEKKEKHRDPVIQRLCNMHESTVEAKALEEEVFDKERTELEHANNVKEKQKAMKHGQKFRPFPIRMKVVKLNDYFTLRIIDQAHIYIIFRDGSTNLKFNIGLIIDPSEIVDVEFLEVMPQFESHLEQFPALSESIKNLQEKIAEAKKCDNAYIRHKVWLQPKIPGDPLDKLAALLSRPLGSPLSRFPATFSHCDCL